MSRIQLILGILSSVLFLFIGYQIYLYFFDYQIPEIIVRGIEQDQCYGGDVGCNICSNKAGEFSLWLDGQPLVNKLKMNSRTYEHAFAIPTKAIANGKHELVAEFVDTTFTKNKTRITRQFFVDNTPLQAALLRPDNDYRVFQGRTLHVQFQVNKEIKDATAYAFAHAYKCFPETKDSLVYECFIPVACEENPNEYLFSIDVADAVGNQIRLDNKFQVVAFPFKKEQLSVSAEKMKQEEELGAEDQQLDTVISELSSKSPIQKLWKGAFCTPIDVQRISCDFGTIRTTQHKGRYAHKAIDMINIPKSVVWAAQNGIVVLKERFAGYGNTVVIDHGMGVLSMYCHLDSFAKINVGDKIAKGNPLGFIGKTGYATGYHLHWELRLNGMPVDPMQWTKQSF